MSLVSMQRAKHVKLKWQKNSGTGSYRGAGTCKDVGVGPYQPFADKIHQIGGHSTHTYVDQILPNVDPQPTQVNKSGYFV